MKNQMKIKLTGAIVLAMCFAHGASAVNYAWSGAGDGTTWSQGANWVGGVVPPAGAVQIAIGTGFPTTSPLPITIGASDVVSLTDQIFGPEWGQTLNIYGSVTAGFGFAPVGAVAAPQSVVNLYGTGSYTSGDSIFLGDMFWFAGGPNVVMNLYDNSQVTANFFALGGHLNIYGGTVTLNNALLTGTPTAGVWGSTLSTDTTRLVNITGGKLVLPGDATTTVNGLISRGILEGYGSVGNVNIDTTSAPGFTVITGVPEPSSIVLLGMGGLAGLLFARRHLK